MNCKICIVTQLTFSFYKRQYFEENKTAILFLCLFFNPMFMFNIYVFIYSNFIFEISMSFFNQHY